MNHRYRHCCWIPDMPALYPCSAFGKSHSDAIAEIEVAIANVLASMAARANPVPEPRYRQAIYAAPRAA